MTLDVLFLVLVSATIHPFWNLLIKKEKCPERTYFLLSVGSVFLAFSHALLTGQSFILPVDVVPFVALSVCGQILYGFALVATYRKGDISIYYPIIRASPLFVIAASFLFLGQSYEWHVIIGVLIVIGAGAVLVVQPGNVKGFEAGTFMLAVLAMCGTGIYSIADGAAMQSIAAPVLFFYVQLGFACVYGVVMRMRGAFHFSAMALPMEAASIKRSLAASVLVYLSYIFILEAYGRGGDVALVTTVRQVSIPLSVLMGGVWLREAGVGVRFAASGVLSVGIAIALLR